MEVTGKNEKMVSEGLEDSVQNSCVSTGTIHDLAEGCLSLPRIQALRGAIRDPALGPQKNTLTRHEATPAL